MPDSVYCYPDSDVLIEWAVQVRTVDIAKGNMFCNVMFIDEQAQIIFEKLKEENYLQDLSRELFAKRAAYFFS